MPATQPRAKRRQALTEARQRARLTQQELADRAGIARTTIARIEGGSLDPSITTALKLARALRSTCERLFGGDE